MLRRFLSLALLAVLTGFAPVAMAQEPVVPGFQDPNVRLVRPNLSDRTRLRFLTVTDFPPFAFIDSRNRLTGFNVDLAREICAVLNLLDRCQIQALPFAELDAALSAGYGEAVMAGLPPNVERRKSADFTRPYFRLPARFVALNDGALAQRSDVTMIERLAGQVVGLVDGTAHAAFARTYFDDARLRLFPTQDEALAALSAKDGEERGEVAAVFGDGLSLSFALQQREMAQRASFVGGPYLSGTYLGQGLSIAVARGDDDLRDGLDYALRSVKQSGKFDELYLRYFPIGFY
jgi:polar amino acid transport system substrate-binding protein